MLESISGAMKFMKGFSDFLLFFSSFQLCVIKAKRTIKFIAFIYEGESLKLEIYYQLFVASGLSE